jgi:hypothetical protein
MLRSLRIPPHSIGGQLMTLTRTYVVAEAGYEVAS